jgi:hypothetical protein
MNIIWIIIQLVFVHDKLTSLTNFCTEVIIRLKEIECSFFVIPEKFLFIYRMSWLVSSYARVIPRRAIELNFEGRRHTGRPRCRWFCQLLEDEEREGVVRNWKGKIGDFSSIKPYEMEAMQEEDGQVLTA